ncbi:sentrin-specific protease 2-like protein, partial [Dinothrombium tinctorium]
NSKTQAKTNPENKDGQRYINKQQRYHEKREDKLNNEKTSLKRKLNWENNQQEKEDIREEIKLVEANIIFENNQAKRFKAYANDASLTYPGKAPDLQPIIQKLREGNLTKEQEEHLENIWQYSTPNDILAEESSISITGHDLKTLQFDKENIGWLNDNIIDFYMQLIVKQTTNNKIFAFPSIFHRTLTERYQDAIKFKRRQQDLHQFNLYLIPLILNNHWTLLFFNPDSTTIGFFNSLQSHGPDPAPILERSKRYFKDLFEKRGRNWTEPTVDSRTVPQQNNGSDCGVYVCYFSRCLASNHPIDIQPEHIGLFRKQIAYEIITKDLIQNLF